MQLELVNVTKCKVLYRGSREPKFNYTTNYTQLLDIPATNNFRRWHYLLLSYLLLNIQEIIFCSFCSESSCDALVISPPLWTNIKLMLCEISPWIFRFHKKLVYFMRKLRNSIRNITSAYVGPKRRKQWKNLRWRSGYVVMLVFVLIT